MKKLLPFLLSFLLVTSLKANYFSAPTTEGVMLQYAVTSPTEPYTVMVMYCEGDPIEVTIPSVVVHNEIDYTVTRIGQEAFYSRAQLTSITIPESVTSIEPYAFGYCSGLTTITIPESVTSIGSHAFYNTPWYNNKSDGLIYINKILHNYKGEMPHNTEIEVLEGTVSIGDNAFYEKAGLTSITIPESVTSIGYGAFSYCTGLTSITIPESVTSIGDMAFYECTELATITIPESVTSISHNAFYNTPWYNNKPDGVIYIGKILYDYKGEMPPNTEIEVLEGTVSIGDYAFSYRTGLTAISLPESITNIGGYAFDNCTRLTSITIPSSVTRVDYSAFGYCSNLKSFICEGPIEMFGEEVIDRCSNLEILQAPAKSFEFRYDFDYDFQIMPLRSITITNGELTDKHLENLRYSRGTLQHLDMGSAENTSLPAMALENLYKLQSAILPRNLEEIPYKVMAECVLLEAIDIPASVINIKDRAFEDCRSLGSVVFNTETGSPDLSNLNYIGNWSFYNCHNLTEITIPEGVTEIGLAAFYGCTYLEALSLSSTVRSIGDNSFAKCSKLKSISISAEMPPFIAAKTFYDVSRQIPVTVPENSINYYATHIYWSEFVSLYEAGDPNAIMGNDQRAYKIFNNNNQISIENPALLSVTVYDVNGRIIDNNHSTLASPSINIDVPKGIYIVLIGNESVKVVL